MLFKDFLSKEAADILKAEIVFDWTFTHGHYELKLIDHRRLTHRRIASTGNRGSWQNIDITELRNFSIESISVAKRIVRGRKPSLLIRTNNP